MNLEWKIGFRRWRDGTEEVGNLPYTLDGKPIRTDRKIYCTGCSRKVVARLTSGREKYPHRDDLHNLPFWTHGDCDTWVGCHHKTEDVTRPLGVLATKELVSARKKIHAIIDPLWRSGSINRKKLYGKISKKIGYEYHSAEIRSVDEAQRILDMAIDIRRNI